MPSKNGPITRIADESMAPIPRADSIAKRVKYGWPDEFGPEGVFMWVAKTDLAVDHSYQRDDISEQNVLEYAKHWMWVKCGALIGILRSDGTVYIVDGQTRAAAAAKRDDITKLPCMVFEWDDIPAEARAFISINTHRKMVGVFFRHRAGLVGGDHVAMTVAAILHKYGYQATKVVATGRTTKAINHINRMVERNEQLADKVVGLAADIAAGHPLKEKIMGALDWIGSRDERVFDQPHRDRLIALGTEAIEAEITRYVIVVGRGGLKVWGQAVLRILNKRLRSNRLCADVATDA